MSRRKIERGRKNKVTHVYEKGVFRGEHKASVLDKEISSSSKHYIRVSSTTPTRKK